MMKRMVVVTAAVLVVLAGCESLERLGLTIERPTARVVGVDLARLDFSEVEFRARIAVDNPNPVGVTLAGFSYSFVVEGVEFLSGDQERGLAIAAFDEREIDFPVTVGFANVVDTVVAVGEQDEADYVLEIDIRLDVPVLGRVTVPLRREGTFPIARPPSVAVDDLVLESLGVSGARLALTVLVENPNGFALTLESLTYSFAVQERVWVDGATDRSSTVPANGRGEVSATFSLSFAEFGRTVRDVLLGDDPVSYTFAAEARIAPELDLMPTVVLPFARSGAIDLRRR